MPDDREDNHANTDPDHELTLADELGIEDLCEPIFGGRGRLFSAAGRESPVAEFTEQFLVLRPPQKPYSDHGPTEDVIIHVDESGILLDELGRQKHIPGAKFQGHAIFWLGEQKPGTLRHYGGWFDAEGKSHRLYVAGEALTTEIIFRLRNKTHDGEISIFPDVASD